MAKKAKVQELNLEGFDKIKHGEIFAHGKAINSPEELFMVDSRQGDTLAWVAVKGNGDDWAIYAYWYHEKLTNEYVARYGQKVTSRDHIKMLVPCTGAVMLKYRK